MTGAQIFAPQMSPEAVPDGVPGFAFAMFPDGVPLIASSAVLDISQTLLHCVTLNSLYCFLYSVTLRGGNLAPAEQCVCDVAM